MAIVAFDGGIRGDDDGVVAGRARLADKRHVTEDSAPPGSSLGGLQMYREAGADVAQGSKYCKDRDHPHLCTVYRDTYRCLVSNDITADADF
jgi:hypothetical protein